MLHSRSGNNDRAGAELWSTLPCLLLSLALCGCQTLVPSSELPLSELPSADADPFEVLTKPTQQQNVIQQASFNSELLATDNGLQATLSDLSHVVSDDLNPQSLTISLEDAIGMSLENSEFLVNSGGFLNSSNTLLQNPQFLSSDFDLPLQQASQQGTEAALTEFDLRLAAGVQWGRNSVIQGNNQFTASNILVSDSGTSYGRIDKPLRSGGNVSVIHNLSYSNDSGGTLFGDPRFAGFLRGEFRHPILAGRGRQLTDIAGPNAYRSRQIGPGLSVAEVAEKTSNLDYQMELNRYLKQTEELYWDCWFAQKVYENQQLAMQSANEVWTRVRNRSNSGLTGGSAADEARAEVSYLRRKSEMDSAEIEWQQAQARLRHRLGPSCKEDCKLLVGNSPTDMPLKFELESSIENAINNRLELVKQDLQIELIELQRFAARNFTKPQLDLVSGVQANGLGDQLSDSGNGNVFQNLADTDDVGWNVGFEVSMPLGFRRERLNVRYLDLLLAKATSARRRQEQEVRQEILFVTKSVEKWERALVSAEQRVRAAERGLAADESDFLSGRTPLDMLLRAQGSWIEAQTELARARTELGKAQRELLYRQGTSYQLQ